MAKIMIVDDDEKIRMELMQFIGNAGYETEEITIFTDSNQIVENILKKAPDLILLDMNLPETNGLILCDKIRQSSEVPIIFVTGNNTSMDELNCIMRGGDDFIAKPYQLPVLLAHITAVLRRSTTKEEKTKYSYKGVIFDVLGGKISYKQNEELLTKNEIKIFYYLMKHPKEIVSRTELIDFLWDNEVFIDDNTLSVNITRIRNKLEKIGINDFIETRRGLGYQI